MKLKHGTAWIFICTYLSLFTCCTDYSEKSERMQPDVVYIDKGDSIYKVTASFIARNLNFTVEKTSKYMDNDSSRILRSELVAYRPEYNKQAFYRLTAERGVKYIFHLDNGTKVFLNSGSSLIFHPSIGKYIELNGEGYFEIEEDSTKIIFNDKIRFIADKGTSINVTAYNDYNKKQIVTVALLEGKAYLTDGKFHAKLNKVGIQAIFDLTNKTLTKGNFDTEDVVSWTKNEFSSYDIDYYTLLQRICRWYDLELDCPAIEPANMVFTGDFKETVQQIIERVNLGFTEMQCRIEGKKLIVSKK
jgi:hypothetical protein